jgi:DNA-binding GntR family transcriptional regulator
VSVWQLPFATEDLPARVTEIFEAVKARDGEKAADLIQAFYQPTLAQFLSDYRRSDAEIDESPIA